jgi:putative addiction module antidote
MEVAVAVIHVRRVGNSSVVTLPPDVLARANLREGDLVRPSVDRAGRVVLEAVTVTPRETRREIIRTAARRERAVLRRLAKGDRT